MPRVSTFMGIVISMYYRDHNPPHFHVEYAEYAAQLLISDCSYREGELPRRIRALVLEWWAEHKNELLANWYRCREDQAPLAIAPLE